MAACAGIFFVGYTVGQVPSNLCLKAIGAPWLTIILVAWGLVSALGCLISTPNGYIVQRLILGIVESGTFPGKKRSQQLQWCSKRVLCSVLRTSLLWAQFVPMPKSVLVLLI